MAGNVELNLARIFGVSVFGVTRSFGRMLILPSSPDILISLMVKGAPDGAELRFHLLELSLRTHPKASY